MWSYEKRLQHPVNIKRTDAKTAQIIISQYGGPDGELSASMRYLSQRFSMPYNEVAGLLTDIGISAAKLRSESSRETERSWFYERKKCKIPKENCIIGGTAGGELS